MVGTILNDVFERIYLTIKLSLMFWGMVITGFLGFGLGPAISVIGTLFAENEFKWQEITWRKMWTQFKTEFVPANKIFWTYFGIIVLLVYNLYLAIQIKHFVFFVISFVLSIIIVLVFLVGIFAFINNTYFEIEYKQLVKLSFASIFTNFFQNLKILFIIGLISILSMQ